MSVTLRVEDMSCEGCENIVENALEEVYGVESADANRESGTVEVEGDVETPDLLDAIDYAGYSGEVFDDEDDEPEV
ncbi:MAG: heavy-metal-associated domain-containing protein [Halodesulfurarchaeum sp.]